MAENKFELQIVTPERIFYDEDVEMIIFRATEGDIGVLAGHIPLTTALTSGMFVIKTGEKEYKGVLHGGFAEIKPEKVTILTDAAEWPEEIDVERAHAARQRAEDLIEKGHEEEVKVISAKSSLIRALARIEVAEYHGHIARK